MDQKEQLLDYIINASLPNASPTYPHGYAYLPATHKAAAEMLHNDEMLIASFEHTQADGSFPVRPLPIAIKWMEAAKKAPAPQPQSPPIGAKPPGQMNGAVVTHPAQPQYSGGVEIEDNVPAPEAIRRGNFNREGPTMIEQYKLDKLNIGQAVFIPPNEHTSEENPVKRQFSSLVSQANKKLHPRNFVIRDAEKNGVHGARIHRIADMVGERPVRTRKSKAADTSHEPNPTAAAPGGFPMPGNPAFGGQLQGGYGQPGGYAPQGGLAPGFPAAPGGFSAPGAPGPMPGGFPAPGGPAPAFGGGFAMPATVDIEG